MANLKSRMKKLEMITQSLEIMNTDFHENIIIIRLINEIVRYDLLQRKNKDDATLFSLLIESIEDNSFNETLFLSKLKSRINNIKNPETDLYFSDISISLDAEETEIKKIFNDLLVKINNNLYHFSKE